MASQRVFWVDNLKGFLIILVVAGHVLQSAIDANMTSEYMDNIFKWIYSFHMPLFFSISGFVYSITLRKKISNSEFLYKWKRRIYTLIYLYFFYSIVMWLFKFFFFHGTLKESVDVITLVMLPVQPISVYWFLYLLLGFFMLVPIIEKYFGKLECRHLFILTIIQCVSMNIELPFYLNRFLLMLPFFVFGIFINFTKVTRGVLICSVIMLFVLFVADIFIPPFMGIMQAYLWSIVFVEVFRRYMDKTLNLFTYAGQHCLPIYLFHPYAVAAGKLIFIKAGLDGWGYVIISLGLSLLICAMIIRLTQKPLVHKYMYFC